MRLQHRNHGATGRGSGVYDLGLIALINTCEKYMDTHRHRLKKTCETRKYVRAYATQFEVHAGNRIQT